MTNSEIRITPFHPFADKWRLSGRDQFASVDAIAESGIEIETDLKRSSFLISRLPRIVDSESEWLHALRTAIAESFRPSEVIVSSYGMMGWEYASWLAGHAGCNLLLVLPPDSVNKFRHHVTEIVNQLNLDMSQTQILMPIVSNKLSKPDRLHLRDDLVFHLANKRFPIAIRKNGFWDKKCRESGNVDYRFAVSHPTKPRVDWGINFNKLANPPDSSDKLFHWTRGVHGPWKGETVSDYFYALRQCKRGNPRDGIHSLAHIAQSGVLRGKGRMIRGGEPVLSFTSLQPLEAFKLICYRAGLGRWNFEPYGLAFDKEVLEQFGARRVIYGSKADFDTLPDADKPYYQYHGKRGKHDWTGEAEWRLRGDIDLASFAGSFELIVPTEKDAEWLRERVDFPVVALSMDSRFRGND